MAVIYFSSIAGGQYQCICDTKEFFELEFGRTKGANLTGDDPSIVSF
jgi:hypothetical protein